MMWEGYKSGDLKIVEWMLWGVFFSAITKLFALSKSYSLLTLFLCYDFSKIYLRFRDKFFGFLKLCLRNSVLIIFL